MRLPYGVAGRHGRAARVFRAEQAGEYRVAPTTNEPEQPGQHKSGQTLEVRIGARTKTLTVILGESLSLRRVGSLHALIDRSGQI